ncbi:MAG: cell division protein ZapA [Bacteriovoracia bacterium]
MTQKKSVEVVVGQQRLMLRTNEDPARVQEVADLVNKRLAAILPPTQPLSHQVLLLLAMTLAEDLLKKQEETNVFKSDVKARSQSLLTQLEREFPV